MFFASIRSPLSSAEILYFPEKCSPDSGRDYSPFFVRKVLPLRTETQASNISSYKSVPYSRILKQTEMRLSHFFLISRIFSELKEQGILEQQGTRRKAKWIISKNK